jgi:type IV secretion system protein VirB4
VGDGSLTDEAKEEVERLINKNFTLDKSQRRLSIVRQFLPIDFAYHKALKPWCQGGSLAYLFDNPEDTLDLSHMTMAGFNMTHLLSVTQKGCSSSVLDYLFHRIKQTMDGRLISLTMEEVWQFLEHPYWINEMNAFLPDSRKNNLFLVFVGQSAEKILSSPLRSYITENTATQLFLPNDKAKHADYVDGFELTEGQVNFIQNAGNASRSFLFRQGKEVAVGRLNLTGLEDYIRVFSGNENTVRLCDEIRAEVGNDPKQWLPLFISRSKK